MIEAYREQFPSCELIDILHENGGYEWRKILGDWCGSIVVETHHIGLGANTRKDVWTNLIRLSPVVHHGWGHDRYSRDLFVLCWWKKLHKGEWDVDEMARIMGKRDLLGYMESLELGNRWVEKFRREILEHYGRV